MTSNNGIQESTSAQASGLANLISTAVALSFGISMAAAAMIVAAGMLLER